MVLVHITIVEKNLGFQLPIPPIALVSSVHHFLSSFHTARARAFIRGSGNESVLKKCTCYSSDKGFFFAFGDRQKIPLE